MNFSMDLMLNFNKNEITNKAIAFFAMAFACLFKIYVFIDMLPLGNSIFLLSQKRYVFPSVKLDII